MNNSHKSFGIWNSCATPTQVSVLPKLCPMLEYVPGLRCRIILILGLATTLIWNGGGWNRGIDLLTSQPRTVDLSFGVAVAEYKEKDLERFNRCGIDEWLDGWMPRNSRGATDIRTKGAMRCDAM